MSNKKTITAPKFNTLLYVANALSRRNLLTFFAARFLYIFYQNTILGWPWLIIRPIVPLVIFIFVFGSLEQFQTAGTPYALVLVVAVGLWDQLDLAMTRLIRCLRLNRRFLMASDFPLVLLPIANYSFILVQFLVYVGFAAVLLVYYYVQDGVLYLNTSGAIFLAPFVFLVSAMLAMGIGMYTSVLFLIARDVRFMMPFLARAWFFLTPILYPLDFMPEAFQKVILYVNPMAPLVETFKWCILGVGEFMIYPFLSSLVISFIVFFLGARFMMHSELVIRDIL